jgi:hypothetical protein
MANPGLWHLGILLAVCGVLAGTLWLVVWLIVRAIGPAVPRADVRDKPQVEP